MSEKKTVTATRRSFLKAVTASAVLPALAQGAFAAENVALGAQDPSGTDDRTAKPIADQSTADITFPRAFTGEHLSRISFPLGGIGTGSIGLGGRGNLQDWEIFNKPQFGHSINFSFPCIWVKSGSQAPYSAVIERSLLPPFDRDDVGLDFDNVPGLPRLREATFLGAFPLARIEFQDPDCPVDVTLEAFSPFQPLDADESGIPCAVCTYQVKNPGKEEAEVVIAWSIDNPVGRSRNRTNTLRDSLGLSGIVMSDPSLAAEDPLNGSFAIAAHTGNASQADRLAYWQSLEWFAGQEHFWHDEFAQSGNLGQVGESRSLIASVSLRQRIPPGETREFRFLLTWHFPNRTAAWCRWSASKGEENAVLGNYYCTRFANAWTVAEYVVSKLPTLESGTRKFVEIMQESSLPASAKDAATANLSTLVSNTSFRIMDGSFHGFEGCGDTHGLGYGTCTHVWNYEVATQCVFPTLARSMRETSFGHALDAAGKMDFRHKLPFGEEHGDAAADGQMGQIVKLYFDWRLCGDHDWLSRQWPGARRAMQYAWQRGGWDADKDGVMEGVQHNTYDVEFYGPNPICQTWYLAALQASAAMAVAMGDEAFGAQCKNLFELGSKWTDANLFNGQFYIQHIRNIEPSEVAPELLPSERTKAALLHSWFQLGSGCHMDQLVGQYMAQLAGLGNLLSTANIQKVLESILVRNVKSSLDHHASVQRVFALNDEAAVVICDYSHGGRPKVPAPYWSEVWSGLEYEVAALMIAYGKVQQGIEIVDNVRKRYDGRKRNPYAETEYGRHYARAMSSWAVILALSGFHYDAVDRKLAIRPPTGAGQPLKSFWSVPSGWGRVQRATQGARTDFSLEAVAGEIVVKEIALSWPRPASSQVAVRLGYRGIRVFPHQTGESMVLRFEEPLSVTVHSPLRISG